MLETCFFTGERVPAYVAVSRIDSGRPWPLPVSFLSVPKIMYIICAASVVTAQLISAFVLLHR